MVESKQPLPETKCMTTSSPILFDTNVLIYNQDKQSEFYIEASLFHEKVSAGKLHAVLSIQNCTEFISVITSIKHVAKPHSIEKARGEMEKYYSSEDFRLIYPTDRTFQFFSKLLKKYGSKKTKHIFDIFLTATMLANNVKTILTANYNDFEMFDEIEVLRLKK